MTPGSSIPLTTETASAVATLPEPPGGAWLLVMPLRAAEQHVLVLVGEADLSTADQLRRELIGALGVRPATLVVELGALEFCDLAGLDALNDAAQTAAYAGVSLTFRGASPQLAWLSRTFPPADAEPGTGPHGVDREVGVDQQLADARAPRSGRGVSLTPRPDSVPRAPSRAVALLRQRRAARAPGVALRAGAATSAAERVGPLPRP